MFELVVKNRCDKLSAVIIWYKLYTYFSDISRNVNTTVATDVARTAKNKSRQQHLITRVENTSQGILLPYGHHKSAQKDLPKSCKLTSSNKRKHDLKYGGMKAQLCGRKTNDASQIGGHRKKQKHAGPSDVQVGGA